MIKQIFVDKDSILEKKFKILRMSIMLGNFKNRSDMLKEYEDTAIQIDAYRRKLYEEKLASKMYTTTTLEEEKERLIDLIKCIEDRIDERNKFIDDYLNVTGNFLDSIDRVLEEDDLPDYKLRLDNISDYLSNVQEINSIKRTLDEKRRELEEKYENKSNNEIINNKLEEELVEEFNKVIINDEYYKNLNYLDIDLELEKINTSIIDKREVMNTFISSYDALSVSGISGAEREEYLSYVQDAKEDYYACLEKNYILNIYKLVLDKITDYDKLYDKRLKIEKLLEDRATDRKELSIKDRDMLEYFSNICKEHLNIIKSQKFNIENIDKLILEISNYEDRLEELEGSNNRQEIVDLLNEFSINKDNDNMDDNNDDIILKDDDVEKDTVSKPANLVVKVKEPVKIDVKAASDIAKLVMKKVVIVLEPKKFSAKRDKLKEADEKLEEEKKQAILDTTNKSNDNVGVELSTKDIFTDDDIEDGEIKVNIPSNQDISIPAEIFIDEPKDNEDIDLFKEVDPFLDDNEFEITDKNVDKDDKDSSLPEIKNIGTVKPTNVLSKLKQVTEENNDIIFPTMGLTNSDKTEVPIVSENYIN